MINTCGTCKYFGDPVKDREPGDMYVPTGYHVCRLISERNQVDLPVPQEKAITVDGSGYFAALCVKEDFGCVDWRDSSAEQCEGCRRGYPKNIDGEHIWPSGIGGGDFRECSSAKRGGVG